MIQWPFASNPTPERPDAPPTPLVGREHEMDLLRTALKALLTAGERLAAAPPRAVFVAGGAGVGKTRLLRGLAAEAEASGAIVLWGGAYESGLLPPYLPFTEALRPYLRSRSPDHLQRLLGLPPASDGNGQSTLVPSVGLQALAQLFPQIAALPGLPAAPGRLTPEQEKFGLLDGIATLLERLAAGQPVLLCLDDLQWADSASLELLLYLTVRLRAASVLLLGAFRNDFIDPSAGSVLGRAITELNRQRLFTLLMLAPLSEAAASILLDVLLPGGVAPDLQQAILARAEGNPFFIEELARALQGSGQIVSLNGLWQRQRGARTLSGALPELPPSIKMTLALHLEPLSAPCRDLLRVAALCGPTFYPDVLAAAGGQDTEAALDLLDEASAAGLIESAPGDETDEHLAMLPAFRFAQRMARELLAGQLPRQSRRRLHAALARALQHRSRTREAAERHAAEIAHHLTQAGRSAEAIHWTVRAGDVAAGRHAQREAIGYYRSALALLESAGPTPVDEADDQEPPTTYRPSQLHWRLAESWFRLGEFQSALRGFQSALEEERAAGDALSLAKLNRLISDAYRQLGQYDQAFGYLQAAQMALGELEGTSLPTSPRPSPQVERELEGEAGLVPPVSRPPLAAGGRPAGAGPAGAAALSEQMLLRQSLAVLMIGAGQGEAAEAALRESQQLAIRVGDRNGQAFALHMLGWVKGWGESIGQAIQLQLQARDLLLEVGDPFHATMSYQGLGIVYQAIGDTQDARTATEAGLALATRYGITRAIPWLRFNLGVLALAQGRWSDATQVLEEARAESERWNDARLKPILRQVLGVLAWRLEQGEQARAALEDGYQAAQVSFEWLPSSAALLGWFLAISGHADAARAYLDQATTRSFFVPIGFAADFYLPFAAEGLLACGDLEAAVALAERIKPWSDRQYYGVSAARILGSIAAAQERWTEAQSYFAAALELCRRAGSRPEQASILIAQARAALAQSRAQPALASALVDDIERLTEEAERLCQTLNLSAQAAQAAAVRAEAAALPQQAAAPSGLPGTPPIDPTVLKGLTPRELEVLRLVADGKTDKEIAEELVISPRTANRHIANIFLKIDVTSRAAAAAYAIRNRLV